MARVRKSETDLPPRTYFKNGAYYHVSRETGKWIRLSSDKEEAILLGTRLNECLDDRSIHEMQSIHFDLSAFTETDPVAISRKVMTAIKIFASSRHGAIARNISFEITKQDVLDLVVSAEGRCMATGIEFSEQRGEGDRVALWKPSLDRIDSKLGYAIGNIRIVCVAFNLSIQDHGDDVFEKLAIGYLKTRLK